VPCLGHGGLALSISVGAMINALWLFIGLRAPARTQPAPGWVAFRCAYGGATALLGAAVVGRARHRLDRLGAQALAVACWRRLSGRRRGCSTSARCLHRARSFATFMRRG
jgi:putative peptidoglycan lipid II flippase